jgi:hypothetical protein
MNNCLALSLFGLTDMLSSDIFKLLPPKSPTLVPLIDTISAFLILLYFSTKSPHSVYNKSEILIYYN